MEGGGRARGDRVRGEGGDGERGVSRGCFAAAVEGEGEGRPWREKQMLSGG